MSDGGRGRASLAVEVWKSSQSGTRAVRRSLHRMVRSFFFFDRDTLIFLSSSCSKLLVALLEGFGAGETRDIKETTLPLEKTNTSYVRPLC